MKIKEVLNRFFHVYAINVSTITYMGFIWHNLLWFHSKCTMDFITLCWHDWFMSFLCTLNWPNCLLSVCKVLRKRIDSVPFLGPTFSFLWSILSRGCGSHLFFLTSLLCRKYHWLLFLLDSINTFLGPLCDFVNPSLWWNLSLAKKLLSFSLFLLNSISNCRNSLFSFFFFSSILFGPPPRLPFISSWFCLQLFYYFFFFSHQFACSFCPIPPRPQTPLSKLEKLLNLQPPSLT